MECPWCRVIWLFQSTVIVMQPSDVSQSRSGCPGAAARSCAGLVPGPGLCDAMWVTLARGHKLPTGGPQFWHWYCDEYGVPIPASALRISTKKALKQVASIGLHPHTHKTFRSDLDKMISWHELHKKYCVCWCSHYANILSCIKCRLQYGKCGHGQYLIKTVTIKYCSHPHFPYWRRHLMQERILA